jgi:ATP-dependent HslUV protease ATP-binding subunit HslU
MKKNLDQMYPSEIVKELDKYIIGQQQAKKVVAIALRNRVRRRRLPEQMQEEVSPKNIIMIGSTGVGKTEIARRLSKLSGAPFVKVEASKYTEVGYVGRDVESMVRDLMGVAVSMVKTELAEAVREQAEKRAEEQLLDLLLPGVKPKKQSSETETQNVIVSDEFGNAHAERADSGSDTREKFRKMLRDGKLDDREVEVTVSSKPASGGIEVLTGGNMDDIQSAMDSIGSIFGGKKKKRTVTVKRAKEILLDEQMDKLVDHDKATDIAKDRVEQLGIIFIDEIDKVAVGRQGGSGPDVSREGVQRDILPIVEGSRVNTKQGVIDTSHILFIAAGAFHMSKPSDLIPELQGRFPLRVELDNLTSEDFYRILKEPENAITKQYVELLKTEGVELIYTDEALIRLSEIAAEVNKSAENIGARRLYTVMELLLEEVSFSANELSGQTVTITAEYVDERLKDAVEDRDLSRYIL